MAIQANSHFVEVGRMQAVVFSQRQFGTMSPRPTGSLMRLFAPRHLAAHTGLPQVAQAGWSVGPVATPIRGALSSPPFCKSVRGGVRSCLQPRPRSCLQPRGEELSSTSASASASKKRVWSSSSTSASKKRVRSWLQPRPWLQEEESEGG